MPLNDFLAKISVVIEDYITAKCGFAAAGKTLDELQNILRERHGSEEAIGQFRELLEQIDNFRFGGGAVIVASAQQLLQKVQTSIKALDPLLSREKRP
jgi:superoxide dismutase